MSSNLVRFITLSTGKVVNVGIFGFGMYTSVTTKFGALYVGKITGGVQTHLYNPYTKAEIRELRFLATGVDNDNFSWPPTASNDCYIIVPFLSCMQDVSGSAQYVTMWPFNTSGTPTYKFITSGIPNLGIFINGVNPAGLAWADRTPASGTHANFNFDTSATSITGEYGGYMSTGTEYPYDNSSAYVSPSIETLSERAEQIPGGGGISYDDDGNPYGGNTSTFGGNDGAGDDAGIDDITKIPVPDIPSVSVTGCGFIKIYNPSKSQLLALSSFLWSSAFDIDSFKKLFSDPMEAIIGLGVVPVSPSIGGSANVKFGDVDSGVSMPVVNNQYIQKNMGSVSVKKYVGCFMDYSPYTSIQIYLPYIGIRELSPDDVMNDTIQLDYNIDVLSGGCAALISTSKKGLLYQYNGSCIANIPLTAINYSGSIQNAVSALGSVATTVVGAVSGAAPLAAMGVAGLATSAANTAVNSKPQIQRSGSMGGAAGLMSSQKPYLIINRPRMSVPDKLNTFSGNTCNVTMKLSGCKGFTMIDTIHLSGMKCTNDERDELMNILQQGVIF